MTFIRIDLTFFTCLVFWISSCQVFAQSAEDRYPGGQLRSHGSKDESGKIGEWMYYFENGAISAVEHFKDGVLHGRVEYYYPNGKMQGEEYWSEGVLNDSAF